MNIRCHIVSAGLRVPLLFSRSWVTWSDDGLCLVAKRRRAAFSCVRDSSRHSCSRRMPFLRRPRLSKGRGR